MTERRIFFLRNDSIRQRAIDCIRTAPEGWRVDVKPATRTLEMNAKFHALCADLERSKFRWAGLPRSADAWKVLLVSGHAIATKEGSEVVPGLEGEFINVRESTALMSKARSSSLIDYALAFMASNGIKSTED